MHRGLKFRIYEEEVLYYPCSENKDADQLCGHREADLRLCFRICKKPAFSQQGSFLIGSSSFLYITMSTMKILELVNNEKSARSAFVLQMWLPLSLLKTSHRLITGKLVYVRFLRFFSCREAGQTQCSNLFEILTGLTTDCVVSCL